LSQGGELGDLVALAVRVSGGPANVIDPVPDLREDQNPVAVVTQADIHRS
jgi:hypothetical protein